MVANPYQLNPRSNGGGITNPFQTKAGTSSNPIYNSITSAVRAKQPVTLPQLPSQTPRPSLLPGTTGQKKPTMLPSTTAPGASVPATTTPATTQPSTPATPTPAAADPIVSNYKGGINYNTATDTQRAQLLQNASRLNSDSDYLASEIARAQQVKADLAAKGMDTTDQDDYLTKLTGISSGSIVPGAGGAGTTAGGSSTDSNYFGYDPAAGTRKETEAEVGSLEGKRENYETATNYAVEANKRYLQEQIDAYNQKEAVDLDRAQQLQNRFGGLYSGGLRYQSDNINSRYDGMRDTLTRDIAARNQQLLDTYGNNAQVIADQIAYIKENEPQLINNNIQDWIMKNADVYGYNPITGQKTANWAATEAGITGNYANPAVSSIVGQINALKAQAERPGITAQERAGLSSRADGLRSQLAMYGVDPSQFGANVNSGQSMKNAAGLTSRTLQGQGQDTNQMQVMAALTGYLPNGQPTTDQQQRELENLWYASDQIGVIAPALAKLYGIPEGTPTQAAMQWAAEFQDNSDYKWYQAEQGQNQNQDYQGLSTSQVIESLRNNYTDTNPLGTSTGITKDPVRREQMYLDVWNSLPPGANPQQAWTALGLTSSEIANLKKKYPETANFNSPSLTSLGGVLSGTGDTFTKYANQYGVDPLLLTAIAMWETGNGKSSAAKNKNNVGGMMGKNGLMTFDSLDDGIEAMARNLYKNYISQGLTTIEQIQKRYAPVGASNDPNGLNKNWINGVTKFYNQLKGGK